MKVILKRVKRLVKLKYGEKQEGTYLCNICNHNFVPYSPAICKSCERHELESIVSLLESKIKVKWEDKEKRKYKEE